MNSWRWDSDLVRLIFLELQNDIPGISLSFNEQEKVHTKKDTKNQPQDHLEMGSQGFVKAAQVV